jgi:SHS2 domain-containing protein
MAEQPSQISGYQVLEHTADIGLTAWGPDPAGAFVEAVRGMFAILLGQDPTCWSGAGRAATVEVAVTGADWPALLVNWLSEFLFRFEVDAFVPRRLTIRACAPPRCEAQVEGICVEDPSHIGGVAIKAVTYHQLAVDVSPARTELRVIFDI